MIYSTWAQLKTKSNQNKKTLPAIAQCRLNVKNVGHLAAITLFGGYVAFGCTVKAKAAEQSSLGLNLITSEQFQQIPEAPALYGSFRPGGSATDKVDFANEFPPPAPVGQGQQASCVAWAMA